MHHLRDRITHATAFVTPVMEWEIAQWVHNEESIQQPIVPWANALTMELYLILYYLQYTLYLNKRKKQKISISNCMSTYLVFMSINGSVSHSSSETSGSPGRSHLTRRCCVLSCQAEIKHVHLATVISWFTHCKIGLKIKWGNHLYPQNLILLSIWKCAFFKI